MWGREASGAGVSFERIHLPLIEACPGRRRGGLARTVPCHEPTMRRMRVDDGVCEEDLTLPASGDLAA